MTRMRRTVVRALQAAAREKARSVGRELAGPWRRGRPGAAAEAGRWIGLGLALGAAVAGVTAAVWAARRQGRGTGTRGRPRGPRRTR